MELKPAAVKMTLCYGFMKKIPLTGSLTWPRVSSLKVEAEIRKKSTAGFRAWFAGARAYEAVLPC